MTSARTEFGLTRTSCSCAGCVLNCQFMPGFLVPSDLGRMIPPGADPLVWAETNLLASPGAVAWHNGKAFRIPTLVPAVKPDGSCINLQDGLCTIHENAPFGCAFFDCQSPLGGASAALAAVHQEWHTEGSLYVRIWMHLAVKDKMQQPAEKLRERMRQKWLSVTSVIKK